MASPTGIIPEELLVPAKRQEVIRWLREQAFTADLKRQLLLGWAQWVGARLRQRDYDAVTGTGIDR